MGLAKRWIFDTHHAPGNIWTIQMYSMTLTKENRSSYSSVKVRSTVNSDDSIFSQTFVFKLLVQVLYLKHKKKKNSWVDTGV